MVFLVGGCVGVESLSAYENRVGSCGPKQTASMCLCGVREGCLLMVNMDRVGWCVCVGSLVGCSNE